MAILRTREAASSVWTLVAAQGALAVLFGLAALFWPGATLMTLVYLAAVFVVAWGVVELVRGLTSAESASTWWLTALFGVLALGLGVYLLRHVDVALQTFITLLGFTLIVRGIVDVFSGYADAADNRSRTLWLVAGAAGIIGGVITLMQPVSGGVAFIWIVGLYALFAGSLWLGASVRSRQV